MPFEQGAFAYMTADVRQIRPVLEQINFSGLSDKQFREMLDKTVSAAAAVYTPSTAPNGNAPKLRFRLAAWGNYPAFRIKTALVMNKDWKKMRSPAGIPAGGTYWHSVKNGISIAVDSRLICVAAAEGNVPVEPFLSAANSGFQPDTAFSAEFIEFCREQNQQQESVFSCWLDNPKVYVNQKLNEMEMPIELPADNIFINLFAAEEKKYEAVIRLQFSSATQAKALATLFSMVGNFISPGGNITDSYSLLAAILFSIPPIQSDKNLDIRSRALSAGEVSLLFNLFPVK